MITDIRLAGQQLAAPRFDTPKKLISWMGAIQAQDYAMARWAVGIRLKSATARSVGEAFSRGEILRTHVMRPTWHLVAAEDIRWMLKLSARRIRSANESLAKGRQLELTEQLHYRCDRLLEKMLGGNRNLTKQQIGEELNRQGIAADTPRLTRLLMRAETEAVVCGATVQRRQANLRPARGTRPARPGAASGRSPGKAGYRLFQKPLTGQSAGFRLVVGTVRHRSPAFGRPHRKIADRRTFRTAGSCSRHESCRAAETSGVPLYLLPAYDEVPDRLQRPYGRPASGAPRQGLHELRYFLSGHPVRRPDRRKLETPGTAGRLLRRNFVFRNGYRRRPGHPGGGRKPIPGILPRRLIFLPRK